MNPVWAVALAFVLRAVTTVFTPPLGLDLYMPVPSTNALTSNKVIVGRRLFFDKRLSEDRTLACATCHDPKRSFSDGRPVARGIHGFNGVRNVPALINRGYGRSFFWDGRVDSLERQAIEPILNPLELGLWPAELERRTGMSSADVAAYLASYVRTIRSGDSAYDRYVAGHADALTPLQKQGLLVFRGKGRCGDCHVGPNLSDEQFHNTGIAWKGNGFSDQGRFRVSGDPRDLGAFKTPTLREVARTAPYMHDGSLATLEEVVDFYSEGGKSNPFLDVEIRPRHFDASEKRALVAFLQSLSGRIREGPN